MTLEALAVPAPREPQIPSPPHDPRDRELLMRLASGWEIRAFKSRWFEFFGPRGLWHVQLWNREKGVSILTPSALTRGAYELSPPPQRAHHGPIREMHYATLARRVEIEHGTTAPSVEQLAWIESVFVRRVTEPRTELLA